VKMAKKEKWEWPAFPEKQEDPDQLDQLAVLDLKVSKEMLETEDHPVMLAPVENQDHQELLVNLDDQDKTVLMDFLEYPENKANPADLVQSEVSVQLVCLDPRDIKVNKVHLEFLEKWEDLALTEDLDHKENPVNKASKVFRVSLENLDDLALLDLKDSLVPKDLLDLKVTMDPWVPLDFLVKEEELESKDTRVTLVPLELKETPATSEHLVCPEKLAERVKVELLANVDLPVHLVKMDKEDQSDQLAQLDQKDPVVLPVQEVHKVLVDLVDDLDDKVPLVNHQAIKKFWKYVAELSKMRLLEPWLDLDQEESPLDHQAHQDIPVFRETKVPLDHLDLLDRTEFKDNLVCKEQLELTEPKVAPERKVIVVRQSLEHLANLALQDFLVLKALLVMEGMVAMASLVNLD